MAEPVKFKLENLDMTKLLEKEILNETKDLGFFPVSLVFVREQKTSEGKVEINLINIHYKNSKELETRTGYVEGENVSSDVIKRMVEIIEK